MERHPDGDRDYPEPRRLDGKDVLNVADTWIDTAVERPHGILHIGCLDLYVSNQGGNRHEADNDRRGEEDLRCAAEVRTNSEGKYLGTLEPDAPYVRAV